MRNISREAIHPNITIRVSGKLFEGHLAYLEQLIQSAGDCHLRPLLDLGQLVDLDHAALSFLLNGESRDFDIVRCPQLIRDWIDRERNSLAA